LNTKQSSGGGRTGRCPPPAYLFAKVSFVAGAVGGKRAHAPGGDLHRNTEERTTASGRILTKAIDHHQNKKTWHGGRKTRRASSLWGDKKQMEKLGGGGGGIKRRPEQRFEARGGLSGSKNGTEKPQ